MRFALGFSALLCSMSLAGMTATHYLVAMRTADAAIARARSEGCYVSARTVACEPINTGKDKWVCKGDSLSSIR
jgi:hypothetical protein